jgi:hypothetical protein
MPTGFWDDIHYVETSAIAILGGVMGVRCGMIPLFSLSLTLSCSTLSLSRSLAAHSLSLAHLLAGNVFLSFKEGPGDRTPT